MMRLLLTVGILSLVHLESSLAMPRFFVDLFDKLLDGPAKRDVAGELYDAKHGIKMGIPTNGCDDAKTNLDVDWDGSPVNYTCYNPQDPISSNPEVQSKASCDQVDNDYYPRHYCMDTTISYPEKIPTFGDHRPLWPIFGEYKFVPPQRWLHNIEHGSVVMLYHPCTRESLVDELRQLVTSCLRKHVITPNADLSTDRPLALIAWGCRLEMAHVDKDEVVQFIRSKALHGPEGKLSKQGMYDYHLIRRAETVKGSDLQDSNLCPGM